MISSYSSSIKPTKIYSFSESFRRQVFSLPQKLVKQNY